MFDKTWLLLEFRPRPSSHVNFANGHNAPHKRPPNTLGLEENHIIPWNTENGSCALRICDC